MLKITLFTLSIVGCFTLIQAVEAKDGCTAAGQSCTCSNTGLKGVCSKSKGTSELYCNCSATIEKNREAAAAAFD